MDQSQWEYFRDKFCESHLGIVGNPIYWQDFHQASEISSTDVYSTVAFWKGSQEIKRLEDALIHDSYPSLKPMSLPQASTIEGSVSQAILQRRSYRENMISKPLLLQDLSDFLYYGYGKKSDGKRNIPSGGALYPLEIYVYCHSVELINPGLYYYSPLQHGLKHLSGKKEERDLESFFADKRIYNMVKNASIYIFITASPSKNIWKYSERGYRFCLIEAGHLAQNINLVATAKHLACLNIGGFYDLEVNQFLKLDGVSDITLYIACVGAQYM